MDDVRLLLLRLFCPVLGPAAATAATGGNTVDAFAEIQSYANLYVQGLGPNLRRRRLKFESTLLP